MPFRYPVALELADRRCVVVGGGTVGAHKAQGLLDAGADVVMIAEEVTPAIEELAGAGALALLRRPYVEGDLEGAFLAIAATDDPGVNAAVYAEGERRRVLVNSVDDPPHCHFSVPSIVRRGDLVLAISTGGRAPALSKRLRNVLSAQFGPDLEKVVDLLGEVREQALATRTVGFETWARRWSTALDDELFAMIRAGRVEEARERLLRSLAGDPSPA